jgi:F-type H+-transporting ATPase subunit c
METASVRRPGETRPGQLIRPALDRHDANHDTRVSEGRKVSMRRIVNVLGWAIVLFLAPAAAFAADGGAGGGIGGLGIGAGLAVGMAGLGCGIGQGLTAGNTTAGIARNPGAAGAMFTNFILGMVLIESIAIYGLVIAIMLQGYMG